MFQLVILGSFQNSEESSDTDISPDEIVSEEAFGYLSFRRRYTDPYATDMGVASVISGAGGFQGLFQMPKTIAQPSKSPKSQPKPAMSFEQYMQQNKKVMPKITIPKLQIRVMSFDEYINKNNPKKTMSFQEYANRKSISKKIVKK